MKKFLFLIAMFALLTQNVEAKSITIDQAMAIAKQQFASKATFNASNAKMTLGYQAMNLKGQTDYYVFNREGGNGFVIVSGDDVASPILGYNDKGSFDYNQAPEYLKYLLDEYQNTLEWLRKNPQEAPSLRYNPSGVAPMFLNEYGEGPHWHQFAPYNNYYPSYNGEHCLAGCVPIAFAHIMKGLQHPTYGHGSNTFTYELGGQTKTASANFNKTYKYKNMKNGYTETSSGWQDCAQMIFDIAVAFNTKFSTESSNASYYHVMKAMVAYFDYNPNIQFLQKANYADATWREMVYTELDEGRPVFYFGSRTIDNSGNQCNIGHAFVFDGYDSEGRVRVIWGFQPEAYNTYFSLDLLSPRVGSSNPYEYDEYAEGFNANQYAIMGVRPALADEPGGIVVNTTTYANDTMPANNVQGALEIQALSGPWQGTLRWAIAAKNGNSWTIMSSAQTAQVDLQENETASIDISGSYNLTDGETYYVVVWSPFFPNNYDWNWFHNDPKPFVVGEVVPPTQVGDVNRDGKLSIADVTTLINMLLSEAEYDEIADVNGDGKMSIADVTALINILLSMPAE